MNYPRLSLLLLVPLAVLFCLEAYSSSAPPEQRRVFWSVDSERSQLWLARNGALEVYDTTGERLARLVTPDIRGIHALDYDARLDEVWVRTYSGVQRFALLAQFEDDGDASRVIRRQS